MRGPKYYPTSMQKPDSVIFDLDGVLWDTCSSCAIAWNNVVERRKIQFRKITAEDVRRVTGKSHEACIRETFVGVSEDHIRFLVEDTMLEDNLMVEKLGGFLYEGVSEGLRSLSARFPLFIVSNCQSGYIETFMRFGGFTDFFKDFECWGNTRRSKAENLASVIARNQLRNPIYIGDAEGDRVAARACKIPFVFASYGFGRAQEFNTSVSSFSEFVGLLAD